MHRRELLRNCVLAGTAVAAAPVVNRGRFSLFAETPAEYSSRTIDLVARSLVVDMLGLLTLDWARLRRWHEKPSTFGPDEYELIQHSAIDVFNPAVDLNSSKPHSSTLAWLANWNGFIESQSDRFLRIDSGRAMREAKARGRIGILLGMQNAGHFRTTADVELFYSKGQRISQLTYNDGNRLGDGCTDRADRGLTEFGAQIIEAMNAVGMVVDASHAGEQTTMDAFSVSKRPVLITHSNCKALVPHPRCVSDDVIKAMARSGGVIGMTCLRPFVRASDSATIEDALDHFDHVARLVGVEHIGIGSDTGLQGRDRLRRPTSSRLDIAGLNHPRRIFDLAEGLIRRGYSDSAIELMLGGNFVRALDIAMQPAGHA